MGEVDAIGAEQAQRLVGKTVGAGGGEHADLGAGAARSQRLVGALAAGGHRELVTRHGFARLGDAAHGADEIEIGGAEDCDHVRTLGMVFQLRMVATAPFSNCRSNLSSPGPCRPLGWRWPTR